MRTLHINPQGAKTLNLEIQAGSAQLAGAQGVQDITVTYGYFVGESEALDEDSMMPQLMVNNSVVILHQTQNQAARANSIGASLRAFITSPAVMSVGGQLEHGAFIAKNAEDCTLNMESGAAQVRDCNGDIRISMETGTVQVRDCNGDIRISIESGTMNVAGVRREHVHRLVVRTGTISLFAGDLLALVAATVEQGVIQSTKPGTLEPIGFTGWRLRPAQHEPGTSVECTVGSGTIMLR